MKISELSDLHRVLPGSRTPLVLASGSPRRKRLLEQLGFELIVDPSNADEYTDPDLSPEELVIELAVLKTQSVAPRHPGKITIGADTIVVLDGTVLGKPANAEEAVQMLQALSNRSHTVWTGVCISGPAEGLETRFAEQTEVFFAALSDEEIRAYVATGNPLDKAGSYGIQDDWGAVFVSGVSGDFYNVVGLPLHAFYKNLCKHLEKSAQIA